MEGPRSARKEEFEEVLNLVNTVFRLSRGLPPTMREEFPHLFNEENVGNLRIILEDKRPVTHVGIFECDAIIMGCKIRVGMIGAVCTHPNYRGRGYATATLMDAMLKMRMNGVDVVLISGIRSLYDRAGCAIAGLAHHVIIEGESLRKLTDKEGKISLSKLEPDKALAIYQKEPVRYHRALEEMTMISTAMALQENRIVPRRVMGIYYNEVLAGYLAILHRQGSSNLRVVEYAGERLAILRGLPEIAKEFGASRIILDHVPHWDVVFLNELRKSGAYISKTRTPIGSIRVLRPESFFNKIKPYLRERVGSSILSKMEFKSKGTAFIIRFKNQELKIEDPKYLTWIVFGVPEEVQEKHKLFMPSKPPLPQKGDLARILQRAFPIPSLTYGLNYT